MQSVNPQEVGIDPERLENFFAVAENKVKEGFLFGGTFLIARHGQVAAARAVGESQPDKGRAAKPDDIFCLFSATKPIAATTVLMKVDKGDLRLFDKIADYVPEFGVAGKSNITIAQTLTHTAGFPTLAPDWAMPKWGDWDATIARISAQALEYEPGSAVQYHALSGLWILGEVVRRVDGGKRSYAQICAEDLFQPLKMQDTHMGVRPDMGNRRVPVQALDKGGAPFPTEFLEMFNLPEVQTAAIPGGGGYSTASDMARFYQMWLNGGELDGVRILSPAMVDLATTIHTGDMPDRLFEMIRVARGWPQVPANRGLGFWVRGSGIFPTYFGSLASSRTFGHAGAGSTMAWADPAKDLVFVGLTSGLVEEDRSLIRWHSLSDMAHACVVD